MIDVGIINYNGGKDLCLCVESLLLQSSPVRVFVFDNASTDDSIELLEKSGKACEIIRSDKNLGYAGACNGLLERMTAEIQVLCNMDLEFDTVWSRELQACFDRHPECGSVASLVMEKSGYVNAVGVLLGKDLFAKNEGSGLTVGDVDIREKKVFGCYGAVMSFRRKVVDAVGRMDDSFFLFFEETEWYFRHNLCGYETVFCPNAKVYHERSLTTVRYSPRKLFYSERNRLRSAVRLLPWSRIVQLPLLAVKRYLSMAKGGVPGKSGDGKKLSKVSICMAIAKAWLQVLLMLPAELAVRHKYEKKYGSVKNKVIDLLKKYSL